MSRVVVPPNSLSGSASPPGTGLNLRWRSLIHPRNAATYPVVTLHSDCGRGLVPKDAESMGREDKPLLDFISKITQHRRNHKCILYANYGSPVNLHPPR